MILKCPECMGESTKCVLCKGHGRIRYVSTKTPIRSFTYHEDSYGNEHKLNVLSVEHPIQQNTHGRRQL